MTTKKIREARKEKEKLLRKLWRSENETRRPIEPHQQEAQHDYSAGNPDNSDYPRYD